MLFRSIVALACCLLAYPAAAHRLSDPLEAAATAPAEGAPVERVSGIVHRVTIDDRVAGLVVQVVSLEQDDGKAVLLQSAQAAELVAESRVEVTGRRNGKALFASGIRKLADAGQRGSQTAKPAARAEGKLALLHADYFAEGRSEFLFEVHDSGGEITALRFHVVPEALQRGMQVVVEGHASADTTGLVPDTVTILALPPAGNPKGLAKAVTTNNALVILMTFSDSPALPFTSANVQAVFAGGPGSGSVVEYFKEASFGQQLLNSTVTGWLPTNVPAPAGCDWSKMGTLGRNAAVAAGYSLASYQNLVYVFPPVSACGWLGLAYIGGNGVWINGRNTTPVYGHELGHNLGLLHAASLRCGGVAIGGACSASEYGDPFDIMGNQSAMHVNAAQKLDLGWITAGTVATYGTGTATYVLNPIENAGGSLYALKIAAAANRIYWLEYRQPIGFDAALSGFPNNGVQIRVASPFETLCAGCDSWSNDTELLDMTPGTATFTDAALVVGQTFTDSAYGISIAVLGATGTALTVRVSTPGAIVSTTTSLASSLNPASAGVAVTFTATVVGNVPSGTVSFADSGSGIAGCGGVAMVGTGNTRTASCTSSGLVPGAHSIAATYSGDAGNNGSSSAALSQVINAVAGSAAWVDDALPAGAIAAGYAEGWNWISTNPAPFSGGLAHQSALVAGVHQHYFYNAASPLAVGVGDTLFAYVYLDPVNPPTEVMLQWNDGTWEHRAYWGANQIGWGTDGTISRRYMGTLPATGQWVRLAVPAANVGLEGRPVNGMAFTLYGGRATWDYAGTTTPPSVLSWVEDAVPSGATLAGDAEGWNWISSNPAPFSGGLAHQSALVAGMHQHYFYNAASSLSVGVGDTLFAYVYLDPVNPPTEVMLQWNDGTWEHRAYWGANQIGWGTDGTISRRYMGALPATGQWVRLAVPAANVGLEGRAVNGMAFTLYGGRATWDYAGTTTATSPPPPIVFSWVDDALPAGAIAAGYAEGWNWTSTNPAPFSGGLAHQSALVAGVHQHYFYNATSPLAVGVGDTLFAYVYLDPVNPPTEVMLQWNDGTWEHRAYWGANQMGWGTDGTISRQYMGALPATGQWVRLAVPAANVGLEGRPVNGMAFTLYGGRATWDYAGK